jgi:hypothetical protein
VNIKNYTSTVPIERSVLRIEAALAKFGAEQITKSYRDGRLDGFSFRIQSNKTALNFLLPCKEQEVARYLNKQLKRPTVASVRRIEEQAPRTAWKLIQDWIEAQLSIVLLGQADPIEVFLPYVWNGTQTFYEVLRDKEFKALEYKK